MNVTCTQCPAKYAVPDEKVRGKKVRITCKHCGTALVIDGTALGDAASASAEPAPTAAAPKPAAPVETAPVAAKPAAAKPVAAMAEPAPKAVESKAPAVAEPKAATPAAAPVVAKAAAAPAEATYLVGFSDERQEPRTISQIVDAYSKREIDDETLIWKDGMADWLAPFDVPEVAAAMKARGVMHVSSAFLPPAGFDDEPTRVVGSPFDDAPMSLPFEEEPKPSPPAAVPTPEPAPVAVKSPELPKVSPAAIAARKSTPEIKPTLPVAAARRTEKRGAVDLFGDVADAGSESDSSLDFGSHDEPAQKLTGARNESSVLFSLDALTKPQAKPDPKKSRDQERDVAAAMFGDSGPDSLMNISAGLNALAAPDFTKPAPISIAPAPAPTRPSDPVEVPNAAPGAKKKGGAIWIAAIAVVAVAAAAGVVLMPKKTAPTPVAAAEPPAAPVQAAPAPAPTEAAPAAAASAPAASPEPSAAANPAAAAAPAAASAKAAPEAPAAAANTPSSTKPSEKPADKPAEKPAEAAKPEPPAAAPAGAEFDKGAAVTALGAAAANAASCKKPDGPTGAGKAAVTFAPSGRATMANITGAFAGTEVGGCVARLFRSARVPPFAGDPVTVSKSFSIE